MASRKNQQNAHHPASDVKANWRNIVAETKLVETEATREALAALRTDFDRELAVLREPGAARKMRKVGSSPADMAKAANRAARSRNDILELRGLLKCQRRRSVSVDAMNKAILRHHAGKP